MLVIAGQTKLDELLGRTMRFPDANAVFDQAFAAMAAKKTGEE
ncbi:hypothetical protein ATSB10_01510 [Dyella thiooxydans]|uniref:Uncharacterized protein n=1 Tax=Dyella thiooxydans TaxID=445710 RepID=A0A161JCP7_9GAMM|nr:hypothetical protein ATSB10_01510 [Dyella thiooxydans]